MAARVTMIDIQAIMDIDSSITNIDAFIAGGNLFVNNALGGEGLPESLLKEIERHVVAHMVSSLDPRAIRDKTEEVEVTYSGKYGMGLDSTAYGQMAILLDTTGNLAKSGMRKASIGIIDYSTE